MILIFVLWKMCREIIFRAVLNKLEISFRIMFQFLKMNSCENSCKRAKSEFLKDGFGAKISKTS